MSDSSKIEWTDATWNPMTGCSPISDGCKNCYAKRMAERLKAMGSKKYSDGFEVTCHLKEMDKPARWKKPQRIFVCSMGDLFHPNVPYGFVHNVFDAMIKSPHHIYQLCTKRPESMAGDFARFFLYKEGSIPPSENVLGFPSNWWIGTTVENRQTRYRIEILKTIPVHVRWLSIEPLLEDLGHFDLHGIHWVVVGGESGPNARPMEKPWVTSIRDQCIAAGVPFFFKGWGGVNKRKAGRLLDGRTWDEYPKEGKIT